MSTTIEIRLMCQRITEAALSIGFHQATAENVAAKLVPGIEKAARVSVHAEIWDVRSDPIWKALRTNDIQVAIKSVPQFTTHAATRLERYMRLVEFPSVADSIRSAINLNDPQDVIVVSLHFEKPSDAVLWKLTYAGDI